jgi:hypothetical protein
VATLACNTLYLLIHPMRQDPDARLGHAHTFLPSTLPRLREVSAVQGID